MASNTQGNNPMAPFFTQAQALLQSLPLLALPKVDEIICAIGKLTNAINELSNILSANVVSSTGVSSVNSHTYANAVRNTPAQAVVIDQNRIGKTINNAHPTVAEPKTHNDDPFMAELVKLKNLRNEAFYRMHRNIKIANLYLANLNGEHKRIPKKFAPNIHRNDKPEIKMHKIEISIQQVQNDVQTMKLHQNIQENKIKNLEEKIKAHIFSCPNEEKKIRLMRDYDAIINRHATKTLKKLDEKMTFLNSNQHMMGLQYHIYETTNTTNPGGSMELNDTEEAIQAMMANDTNFSQTQNQPLVVGAQKRKAIDTNVSSDDDSSCYETRKQNFTQPPKAFTSKAPKSSTNEARSQPISRSTRSQIPTPKNGPASSPQTKMKGSTQP
jgi:hypothetical protein